MDSNMMGMSGGFGDVLRNMMAKMQEDNREYEPMVILSPAQQKEWDDLQAQLTESMRLAEEGAARKNLFWVRIRRQLGPDGDRDTLKVDDGVVFGTKKEVKKNLPEGLRQLTDGD